MPGTESILAAIAAQVPITALFVWFVTWMRKAEAADRKAQAEVYSAQLGIIVKSFSEAIKDIKALALILVNHDNRDHGENEDLRRQLRALGVEVPND